jgi:hypothetical protein
MKLIIENFEYKGIHIDRYESDLPQVTKLDEVPMDKLEVYIKENLDELIK